MADVLALDFQSLQLTRGDEESEQTIQHFMCDTDACRVGAGGIKSLDGLCCCFWIVWFVLVWRYPLASMWGTIIIPCILIYFLFDWWVYMGAAFLSLGAHVPQL